jgi:hypothetical protein
LWGGEYLPVDSEPDGGLVSMDSAGGDQEMLICYRYLDKRVEEREVQDPPPVRDRLVEVVDVKEIVMGEDFVAETIFRIHEMALCRNAITGEVCYIELTPDEARIQ